MTSKWLLMLTLVATAVITTSGTGGEVNAGEPMPAGDGVTTISAEEGPAVKDVLVSFYGEVMYRRLSSADRTTQSTRDKMRKFAEVNHHVPATRELGRALSYGYGSWKEAAAVYLMERARYLHEQGAESADFAEVFTPVRLGLGPLGSYEFTKAVLKYLSLSPNYRKEAVQVLFRYEEVIDTEVVNWLKGYIKDGITFEGDKLFTLVVSGETSETRLESELSNVGAKHYQWLLPSLVTVSGLVGNESALSFIEKSSLEMYEGKESELKSYNYCSIASGLCRFGRLSLAKKIISDMETEVVGASDRMFIGRVVRRFPLEDANKLALRPTLGVDEEDPPESYIRDAQELLKKLPGDRMKWNPSLREWIPTGE